MEKLKNESLYEKAAMRVILQPVVDEEIAEFDEWNKIPHEYSPEFERRIVKIFRKDRLKRSCRSAAVYGRKIAVCFAVIVTLALVACAAIEPLRERVADAFVTWYEKWNGIVYETSETTGEPLLPTYVPDGYEITYYDVTDELAVIEYVNNKNSFAFMRTKNYHDKESFVDNEKCVMEEIEWRDGKAIYFKPIYEGVQHSMMWEEGGYVYIIDSSVSKEELIKFAESVK